MNKKALDKVKNLLKQILPQPVKTFIKKARILTLRGGRFYCPVCERGFRKFFEFGVNPRPNAMCSGCGSLERHRLLWIALCDLQDKGLSQKKNSVFTARRIMLGIMAGILLGGSRRLDLMCGASQKPICLELMRWNVFQWR